MGLRRGFAETGPSPLGSRDYAPFVAAAQQSRPSAGEATIKPFSQNEKIRRAFVSIKHIMRHLCHAGERLVIFCSPDETKRFAARLRPRLTRGLIFSFTII